MGGDVGREQVPMEIYWICTYLHPLPLANHSFNAYFWRAPCVPGTVLGTGDTTVLEGPCPPKAMF